MARLRATVVVEYDADPGDYQTDDPKKMAAIDLENWQDPMNLVSSFDEEDFKVTVEPIA